MADALRAAIATAFLVPTVALAASNAPRVSLTLQVIGPGAVAVSPPGSRCAGYLTRVHVCRASYARGTRVRLTAVPTASAKLSSFRGVLGRGIVRTLTMNTSRLVTATFVKRP